MFVVLPPELVEALDKDVNFYLWEYLDNGSQIVRFVTSWATELSEVKRLCSVMAEWMLDRLEEVGI